MLCCCTCNNVIIYHMSGTRSGDHCCWCLKREERRRHLINAETKEGRLADHLKKFTVLFSVTETECESNWLCQSCFLILRSCVAAETRLSECKNKLLKARSPTVPCVISVKRSRPLIESPASQPSQSAKAPKISITPPTKRTDPRVC